MTFTLPERLDSLYIFPLPDVQLFPHALLPLHVFEPRYRELARDCLASTRLVAMPTLEPGFEPDYQGRPAVSKVCGVGEVVRSQRYPDGRYDLVLRGCGRVRIVEELPPAQAYRLVRAERLDENRGSERALDEGLRSLVVLCDRLASVLPTGGETLTALARQEKDASAAADVLAAAVVTDSSLRQALLEELDLLRRLDQISTVVATLAGRFRSESDEGPRTLN